MHLIGLLQVPANPRLEIGTGLGPGVLGLGTHGVQCCESNSKCHVFDVVFGDDIVLADRKRWQLQEFEQRLTCETPTFLVLVRECFRVGQGLSERDYGRLAI